MDENLKEILVDEEKLLLKKAEILLDEYEEIDEAKKILLKLRKNIDNLVNKEVVLDTLLLLIDIFRIEKNYKSAFYEAFRLISLFPNSLRAKLAIATAHFELGEYLKALNIIEGIKEDDFLWLKAQVLQAMGDFSLSDRIFNDLSKKSIYHKPVRLTLEDFIEQIYKNLKTWPDFLRYEEAKFSMEIVDIIDIETIKNSDGKIGPMDLILLEDRNLKLVKKNIENFADNKKQISKIIESALIHALSFNE